MSPRGINEVTVATAIAEPGLREQASQALRGVTVTLLGDIWTSGGIAGLGAELSRSQADILLLGLPGLAVDPTEAVRQIRTLSGGPRVIALDNKAEPEVILQAMRGGASEFLYPPFNGQFAEAVLRVADECARQEPARSAAGSVYAFVSAKGGCGATTMACHTAAYLRRQTKKQVLLADLDFCSGNASLLMQAAPRYTMVDALENLNRVDITLWKALVTSTKEGVDMIAAPSEPFEISERQRALSNLVRFWRTQYDYTVLDLGHGLTPATCSLLDLIDSVILISTQELPALRMTKQTIRTVTKLSVGPNRLRLVMNRIPKRTSIQPAELERIMDFPIYAVIPNEPALLEELYTEPRLVEPESPLGKPISAMASKLAGLPAAEPAKSRRLSFFR